MPSNEHFKMYTHPVTNEPENHIVAQALSTLRPHLPTSIPLYRRLQFGRFFEATTLITSLQDLSLQGRDEGNEEWVMAFVDRSCRPETEVWLFGSWETGEQPATSNGGEHISNGTSSSPDGLQREQNRDGLVKSIVRAIRDLGPLPQSIHQKQQPKDEEDDHTPDSSGLTRTNYTTHLLYPSLVLFGATHHTTTQILDRNNLIRNVFDAGLVPNWTYIFDLDDPRLAEVEAKGLPEGLEWGELDGRHWRLVRSRTQIPRQERTLAELPNLAIYPSSSNAEGGTDPIAWVFVGLDGSLTTLHVEEAWRGKGLARSIAVKLWKEKMPDRFFEGGGMKRLAHDYVISGNQASAKVSERLGGKYIGDTFWVRVDLEAA